MYRHMLVPIDASDLSIEVVGNAVAVARSVGARVTFFHAVQDHAASLYGDAELLRVTSPEEHAYAVTGKARELLAKAEAAARAFGVPCASHWSVADKPASAIVAAARTHHCDLIVMASHGRRSKLGMAVASDTLTVLMSAGLPVLVTHTGEPAAPARAIGILRDEHRSMAAVLHVWMHALSAARQSGGAPDVKLMRAMLHYLQGFPQAVHHPKEEAHLFGLLRERSPETGTELDELERQHRRDEELLAGLARQVDALAGAAAGDAAAAALAELDRAVQAYAAFLWDHMGREESVILPAAQRGLTAEDWEHIDTAFARDRDPGFGADIDREYRHLFSRIVNAEEGIH